MDIALGCGTLDWFSGVQVHGYLSLVRKKNLWVWWVVGMLFEVTSLSSYHYWFISLLLLLMFLMIQAGLSNNKCYQTIDIVSSI